MERAYHIWSLRVSTCHSSLFSKHFIGWKTLKVVQLSVWLIVSAASPAKSDFTLLWDDLFNYCRTDLQSHLPDNYLANSFDTWLCSHPFRSKKLFEPVNACLHSNSPCFTLDLQSFVTIYACMGVHRKVREIFQMTYALQRLAASPWHLFQTMFAVWFLKTNFHTF